MIKYTIAFDVDGTLRDNKITDRVVANEQVRTGLIWLSSMKNTRIVLWSGGGELYARQIAEALGVTKYVDAFASKNYLGKLEGKHAFDPEIIPDIAVDDIQDCELGVMNLIVNCK